MLLCDRVLRPQGGDCRRGLAILLENLGQLLDQPFVRDVRLTKGCEHRAHRALRHAKRTTSLGDPLVRSLRRGFDKRSHLLGCDANCKVLTLQDCRTDADIADEVLRCTRGHVSKLQMRRSRPLWLPRSPCEGSSAPPRSSQC